ncbi:MAG: Fic family protein [Gammaproteobacteria bacterium]
MAHKWHPITDMDDFFEESVHEELRHLAEVWREQKSNLDPEQLQIFTDKLKREWAIETGQIEGVYDIDPGTTETLIERGISEQLIPHTVQNPGKTLAMLQDHQNVVDGLFDFVKGGRALSVSYIKELHAALTQNQDVAVGVDQFGKKADIPLLHGAFKKMSNDPKTPSGEVHQYCPPEHTASEMDNLIAMYSAHGERKIPPLAAAAWLHHRFTQIHPFQDGNGRVARCLASVIFIKAGWFPLVINRDARNKYLNALEAADGGDLSALINLFAKVQSEFFYRSFGLQIETTIESGAETMRRRDRSKKWLFRDYRESSEIAGRLVEIALGRMRAICDSLNKQFPDERSSNAHSHVGGDAYVNASSDWKKMLTERHGRRLNLNAYRAAVNMRAEPGAPAWISACFSGTDNAGEIVCAVFCSVGKYTSGDGSAGLGAWRMVSDDMLFIRNKESFAHVQKRFIPWLAKALSAGMDMWRKNLQADSVE